jgi:hypothetical protein
MNINYRTTIEFVKSDWRSNPVRLMMETINWGMNVAVAMTFTLTVPDVPLLLVYPMFFTALTISIYSAISRGSFGLLITSITMLLIDLVGYAKLLML